MERAPSVPGTAPSTRGALPDSQRAARRKPPPWTDAGKGDGVGARRKGAGRVSAKTPDPNADGGDGGGKPRGTVWARRHASRRPRRHPACPRWREGGGGDHAGASAKKQPGSPEARTGGRAAAGKSSWATSDGRGTGVPTPTRSIARATGKAQPEIPGNCPGTAREGRNFRENHCLRLR